MSDINSLLYEFLGFGSKIKGKVGLIYFNKEQQKKYPHQTLFLKNYLDYKWHLIVDDEYILGFLGYIKTSDGFGVIFAINKDYNKDLSDYYGDLIGYIIDSNNVRKKCKFEIYMVLYDSIMTSIPAKYFKRSNAYVLDYKP